MAAPSSLEQANALARDSKHEYHWSRSDLLAAHSQIDWPDLHIKAVWGIAQAARGVGKRCENVYTWGYTFTTLFFMTDDFHFWAKVFLS